MSVLIALPKGRLLEEVQNLFKKIDIEFDTDSRKLIIDTSQKCRFTASTWAYQRSHFFFWNAQCNLV